MSSSLTEFSTERALDFDELVGLLNGGKHTDSCGTSFEAVHSECHVPTRVLIECVTCVVFPPQEAFIWILCHIAWISK